MSTIKVTYQSQLEHPSGEIKTVKSTLSVALNTGDDGMHTIRITDEALKDILDILNNKFSRLVAAKIVEW